MLLLSSSSRDSSVTSCRAGEGCAVEWNSPQGLGAGRGHLKGTAQEQKLRRICSNLRLSWQQLLWRTARKKRNQALQPGHLHQHVVPWLGPARSLAPCSILHLGIGEDHLDVAVIPATQLQGRALAGLKGGQGTLPAWQQL